MKNDSTGIDKYDSMARLLELYYPPAEMFSVGGRRYPIRLIPASIAQMKHPDSVLGSLDPSRVPCAYPEFGERGDVHICELINQGVELADLPTFCLASFSTDSTGCVRIGCRMDTYFNMLRTCEMLELELVSAPDAGSKEAIVPGSGVLALRDRVRETGGTHPFSFDPERISSAVGISTLVVYRKNDGYRMLIGKREKNGVATGRGESHVIPACMFQPLSGSVEDEYDVSYNILREYLEEVFSIEEEHVEGGRFDKRRVTDDPNVALLSNLGAEGKARLLFTGCLLNYASLRLDICGLIFVNDPSWYDAHSKGVGGLARFSFNKEWEIIEEVDISGYLETFDSGKYVTPDLSASGAGAVHLGLECLKSINFNAAFRGKDRGFSR